MNLIQDFHIYLMQNISLSRRVWKDALQDKINNDFFTRDTLQVTNTLDQRVIINQLMREPEPRKIQGYGEVQVSFYYHITGSAIFKALKLRVYVKYFDLISLEESFLNSRVTDYIEFKLEGDETI